MWNADLSASETGVQPIDDAARAVEALGAPWAWYRAGQQLELVREGAASFDWPRTIVPAMLHDACVEYGWSAWPTGRSELALGWLRAHASLAADARLAALARAIGEQMQADALARAQNVQRVLYDIAYLASSISERTEFLQAIHERRGTRIDAENCCLALYDRETGGVTYPYYIDLIDTEAVDTNHMDMVDPENLSLTGYV